MQTARGIRELRTLRAAKGSLYRLRKGQRNHAGYGTMTSSGLLPPLIP